MNTLLKNVKPHIIAFFIFFLTVFLFIPSNFSGMIVKQHDIVEYRGASKSNFDHREKYDEEPLWASSVFSGMPSNFIGQDVGYSNLTRLFRAPFDLTLPHTSKLLILSMICFYIFALVALRLPPWVAILGALAYSLASYNPIIIQAGHNSKSDTLATIPLFLAGILILFHHRKLLLGGAIAGIGLSLNIMAGHPQITYYFSLAIGVYILIQTFLLIKNREFDFLKKSLLTLVFVCVLALGSNTARLWGQLENTPYTIRGEQVLDSESNSNNMGYDYITSWSYGRLESFNFLIPNLKGGASSGALSEDSKTYKALSKLQGAETAKQTIKRLPLYWGDQPFTSGPMYIGAVALTLGFLGLLLLKGPLKWWLISVISLSILLSWGRYFPPLTNFFIEYIPLYNKFRAPSTINVLIYFSFATLAVLALKQVINYPSKIELTRKALLALAITGGTCVVFLLAPSLAGDFTGAHDSSLPKDIANSLRIDRVDLLRQDAWRSLMLCLGTTAVVVLFFARMKKVKFGAFLLLAFLLIDLIPIDKRYLSEHHFAPESSLDVAFPKRLVDGAILKDKTLGYRTLDLSVSTFNTNATSYYHRSIGGYSAAKLRRYQDIIEHHLQPEIRSIAEGLKSVKTLSDLEAIVQQIPVINMLNGKYIIINPDSAPIANTYAYGPAWMIQDLKWVNTPEEEIAELSSSNLKNTAIIHSEFKGYNPTFAYDPTAQITLKDYRENLVTYDYQAKNDQFVVFSEIFYPKGWKAFIDGKEYPYVRVNYTLRGMTVPKGNHTITWKFNPNSYHYGIIISYIFSSVLIFLFLYAIWRHYQTKPQTPPRV